MSKKLTLDYLALRTKNARLDQLTKLNLWGSDLDDVSILEECTNLEIISLAKNKISSLTPFRKMMKLSELYLRSNDISDIKELDNLKNCKQLKVLSLNENPIAEKQNYRMLVINALPQITKLDDVPVDSTNDNSNTSNTTSTTVNKSSTMIKKGSSRFKKKTETLDDPDDSLSNINNPFHNNIERGSGATSTNNMNCEDNGMSPLSARTPLAKQEKLSLANVGLEHLNNINNNNNTNVSASPSSQMVKPKTKSRIGGVANFKKFSTSSNIRYNNNNNNSNNSNNSNKKEQNKLIPTGDRSFDGSLNEQNDEIKQTQCTRPTLNKSVTLDNYNNKTEDSLNKAQYKKKIIGNCSLTSQKLNDDVISKTNRMAQSSVIERAKCYDDDNDKEEEEEMVYTKDKRSSTNEKVIHEESEEDVGHNNEDDNKSKIIVDSVKLLLKALNEEELKEIKDDIDKLLLHK